MTERSRKLVIIGDGEFAEIACEYFTHDSPHEVVAFAVEEAHRKKDSLFEKPVIGFEEIERLYPPDDFEVFVALTYSQLNRVRTRLYRAAKTKGYKAVSYVSSHAFVWRDVVIGENVFVFENNVIQYGARLGDNIILWSGNHVAHRVRVAGDTFITGHVCIAGYAEIGTGCFLGANSTIGDFVKIADDCVVGAGAVVLKDTEPGRIYRGNPAVAAAVSSLRAFNVKEAVAEGP
jgi:sugar O-acyltransferase (sialic acid O-acetyltransferase NeuD family)